MTNTKDAVNSLADSASAINLESNKPVCLIVIGMAGAGKTSFVSRLNTFLHTKQTSPYVINLDPACHEVPYPCNIDIRDTVNYKEVMKQYSLGPNGAIMTSLNLFSTKFNQIIDLIEKRSKDCKYVIIDTPGQIEVFTWSASGSIITEALASSFPTIICYVMDTSRSVNPVTFMSNMLYACSILYKSKLPFVIVMNKNDIIHHSFIGEWLTNFESFQNALENETSYMSNLTRSLSLVLDEFYQNINFVGLSSATGDGFNDFMEAIKVAADDYDKNYKPEYEKFKQKKLDKEKLRQQEQMKQFEKDLENDKLSEAFETKQPKNILKTAQHSKIEIKSSIKDSDDEEEEAVENEDVKEQNEKLELESFSRFIKQQKD
jgi:GTPase SAR1 family protein